MKLLLTIYSYTHSLPTSGQIVDAELEMSVQGIGGNVGTDSIALDLIIMIPIQASIHQAILE